jgi:hypothetical protein
MNLRWQVCLLFAAASCGKSTSPPSSIGPSGGQVEAAGGGATVAVPAGALTTSTNVTVTGTSATAPTGTTSVGAPYLFGPEGTQFAQPVTVTLAFDPTQLPAGFTSADIVVFTAPAGTMQFSELPTTLSDATHVQATTTHFSIFLPAVHDKDKKQDMAVAPADLAVAAATPDMSVASAPPDLAAKPHDLTVPPPDLTVAKPPDLASCTPTVMQGNGTCTWSCGGKQMICSTSTSTCTCANSTSMWQTVGNCGGSCGSMTTPYCWSAASPSYCGF